MDRKRLKRSTKDGTLNSIYYVCRASKYKALITLNPDSTVVRASLHQNDDEHILMTDLEIILFKEKVKDRASIERTPSQSLYNGEVAKLFSNSKHSTEETQDFKK